MEGYAIDSDKIFVAGLSAGGAAAAIMGMTYPELYAAIGVHSGLSCGVASDVASAFAAMREGGRPRTVAARRGGSVRAIVFHGDADKTVNPINGDQVAGQYQTASSSLTSTTHGKSAGGVAYTRTTHADGAGRITSEQWLLHGVGHAWSGGSSAGTYTDPRGPDASREMLRFFLQS